MAVVVEGAKLSVTSAVVLLGANVVAKLGTTVVEFISGAVVGAVVLAGQQIGSATAFIPEQISLSSSVFNASTIKSPHVLATVMAVSSITVIPPFGQTSHGTCAGVGQQVSCASCIMEQPTSLASVIAASDIKSPQVFPLPMTILLVPAVIPSMQTWQVVILVVLLSVAVVETIVPLSEGDMVGATEDDDSVPLPVVVAFSIDSEQQFTSDTFI